MKNRVCAVIVAAGSSSRMGGTGSKVLMELCGEPVLVHTLRAFSHSHRVDKAVVVCREEDREAMASIAARFPIVKAVVKGGSTRQASVAAGVAAAGDCDIIAIHDGARPLVTPEEIDSVIADCEQWGASTLAVPVVDTIKTADEAGIICFCFQYYESSTYGKGRKIFCKALRQLREAFQTQKLTFEAIQDPLLLLFFEIPEEVDPAERCSDKRKQPVIEKILVVLVPVYQKHPSECLVYEIYIDKTVQKLFNQVGGDQQEIFHLIIKKRESIRILHAFLKKRTFI